MVAVCQFQMPEKFQIAGTSLDDEVTKDIIDKIVANLQAGKAQLHKVETFCDVESLSDPQDEKEPGTYFELILILDEHQIQDYKIYDALIVDKAIESFRTDDHYISSYWTDGNQEHIGFETEF